MDRKIKGEGRVGPKSRNLLGTGRPLVTSVATGLFAVEGRARAVVQRASRLRQVVLATALVAGVVLPLTSVARLDVSPSAPLELYRTVDPPLARGALVVTCVPVATPRLPQRAGPPRPGLLPGLCSAHP